MHWAGNNYITWYNKCKKINPGGMLRLQLKHVTLRTKYIRQKNDTKLDHKSKE